MEINPKDIKKQKTGKEPYDFKTHVVNGFKIMCGLFSQCSFGEPL